MKKVVALISTSIVIIFFGLFLFLPKSSFSIYENRYLEKIPNISVENIFNGTYMKKFESYVEDHFPFREMFLNLKTNTLKLFGVTKQNDVYFGKDKYLLQMYEEPQNSDKIIRIVNRFIEGQENIDFYFLMAPTSIYVNNSRLPKNSLVGDEEKTINYYKEKLNVNFIDVKDSFLKNKDKNLYYKTDHHWTTYGANEAYLVYCESMNLTPYTYEYELVSDKFYGTLYSKVIDNSLKHDNVYKIIDDTKYEVYYNDTNVTLDTMYNEDYLENKDKYSYFLDNNHDLITITNKENNSNDEILIIKDSYANSFIPFIAKHYKKVHVIDPRYYRESISSYIKENNIYKVVFLYNILTIDTDLGILSIR